jgi:integrative and conjugative element protein (TIGR02256 family)
MPDRSFRSLDGRFGLRLRTRDLRAILGHCKVAGSNETGGILAGRYSSNLDCAVVHHASAPPNDSRAGRTWFNRGIRGLQSWLDGLWRSRRYYLGEWHYHPGAAPDPSRTDEEQMASIAGSVDYKCPEPILLIIGGDPNGAWAARAFVYVGSRLIELVEATSQDGSDNRR